MKVLVVEDPSQQQKSLGARLQEPGYTVDVVNDSDRAIAYVGSRGYDVIILDLMLPRESSLLVLHEIRESDRDVKILLLSEHDQIHDRVTALIQGANDYLVKPFAIDELHARLRKLLQGEIDLGSIDEADGRGHDTSEYTNRLIAELLRHCTCDQGPIELVISEIKPAALLRRVYTEIEKSAAKNDVRVKLPSGKWPPLLSDARLMQHLLVKLMSCAVHQCPPGGEIEIAMAMADGYGTVSIESPLVKPMSTHEIKEIFRNYDPHSAANTEHQPIANLSLARNYAERLNLELRASLVSNSRFRMELSKIKII